MLAFDYSKLNISEENIRLHTEQIVQLRGYIQGELKDSLLAGDWQKLDSLPIFFDVNGEPLISFGDDCWDFSLEALACPQQARLFFSYPNEKNIRSPKIPRIAMPLTLKRELKSIILCSIFYVKAKLSADTLVSKLDGIRKLTVPMVNMGMRSFSEIDNRNVRELFDLLGSTSHAGIKRFTKAISALVDAKHYVSFGINVSKQNETLYRSAAVQAQASGENGEGFSVYPIRLYSKLTSDMIAEVEFMHRHLADIKKLALRYFNGVESVKDDIKARYRKGELRGSYVSNYHETLAAFNAAGIPVADDYSSKEWDAVWDEVVVYENTSSLLKKHIDGGKVGNKVFATHGELKSWFQTACMKCQTLLLAFSGMRMDELYRVHPLYGMQPVSVGDQEIDIFTTRQSKITMNNQTIEDTFVTTSEGKKAFDIWVALQQPIYEKYGITSVGSLFYSYARPWRWRVSPKDTSGNALRAYLRGDASTGYKGVSWVLTQKDIDDLNESEGVGQNYKLGETFPPELHSFRRSLAYYLIGYELCSYPQLKQQFSHYSLAMTRWYARNAHKGAISPFNEEVKAERVQRQAKILSRIHSRIANKERLGGGFGMNLYRKGVETEKLDSAYWRKELEAGRRHLHAIAPSMWCTNSGCGMRMNIDLSECVDCEFDVIEDVAYVESRRMRAMALISLSDDEGTLNHSLLSKLIVDIRSAEAVMAQLDFPYERYELPETIEPLVTTF
ncbi:hypothetical protein ACNO7T_21600 [Vibrio campbellii]